MLIQESLAKIGVQVTIQKMLTAAYAARQFNQRDMPMFFWDWISFTNDPYYGFTFLSQCKQGTNYANFCSSKVDSLIAKGMYEANKAKRAKISDQIQRSSPRARPTLDSGRRTASSSRAKIFRAGLSNRI